MLSLDQLDINIGPAILGAVAVIILTLLFDRKISNPKLLMENIGDYLNKVKSLNRELARLHEANKKILASYLRASENNSAQAGIKKANEIQAILSHCLGEAVMMGDAISKMYMECGETTSQLIKKIPKGNVRLFEAVKQKDVNKSLQF